MKTKKRYIRAYTGKFESVHVHTHWETSYACAHTLFVPWCPIVHEPQYGQGTNGLQFEVVFHTRGQRKPYLMHNRTPPSPQLTQKPWRKVRLCTTAKAALQTTGIQFSKEHRPFPSSLLHLAAAYLLSITVNITGQEVEGWEEEAKQKPAAQCTCLAAARSDIWGHGDLVERADAHWCTGTGTWQLHKWLKQKKKISTNIWQKRTREKNWRWQAHAEMCSSVETCPQTHSRVDMAHWHARTWKNKPYKRWHGCKICRMSLTYTQLNWYLHTSKHMYLNKGMCTHTCTQWYAHSKQNSDT